MQWVTQKTRKSRTFLNAFKATDIADGSKWFMKNMEGMILEDHARKRVQLHSAAGNIAQWCAKTALPEFGEKFQYRKVHCGFLNDVAVTVEEFIHGQFAKYINNDGKYKMLPLGEMKSVCQKAQSLVHYSYKDIYAPWHTGKHVQFMRPRNCFFWVIWWIRWDLFLSGNLSGHAISNFVKEHGCSGYCVILALETTFFKWWRKCKFRWRQW